MAVQQCIELDVSKTDNVTVAVALLAVPYGAHVAVCAGYISHKVPSWLFAQVPYQVNYVVNYIMNRKQLVSRCHGEFPRCIL